jgi:hypothetical protein
MAVDVSETLALIEVELARTGIAHRQQAWKGDVPTGLRRWVILDRDYLKRLVGSAIAGADGPEELAAVIAESKGYANPLGYFLGVMSPNALYRFYFDLLIVPTTVSIDKPKTTA